MQSNCELEQLYGISLLICHFWKIAADNNDNMIIFEHICYELGDNIGDDLLAGELVFLSELNFERG
jgi:hypothetical protein